MPDDAPQRSAAADRDATWAVRVEAAAIIGFSLAWVLVMWLVQHGVYGNPRFVLEVNLFRTYAENILAGQVPYRDFAFEYPPLALVPILGPLLLAGSPLTEEGYRVAFGLFEAAIGMVTMIFVMRAANALELGRRGLAGAAIVVAASPLLLGPLMLARFDLWPALFAAAAIWLFVTDRFGWAAVALALGVLAKVYPIVLTPFLVLYLWRRSGRTAPVRFVVILAGVVGVGLGPFFLAGPDGVLTALGRAFLRPLQVESIGAALIYAANTVVHVRFTMTHTYDSFNLTGSIAAGVSTAQSLTLAVVLAATLVLFLRGRPTIDRLVLALGVALCGWVAFGKVFSPQYLIWLIAPLAVVKGGRWSPHLIALTAAIVLTGLYYPKFYVNYYYEREALWVGVVLVRDLILVALTGYLLVLLRPGPDTLIAPVAPVAPAAPVAPLVGSAR